MPYLCIMKELLSGNKKYIALNLLLWLLLYAFWIFVFQHASITITRTMQIEFCYLVFIAANYYFQIYFAIPRYLGRQKYAVFLLASAIFLLISTWARAEVVLFINAFLYNIQPSQIDFTKLYFNSLLNITIWSLCLIAAKTIFDRIRFQQYELQIEKEKIKNELAFLRAQNNPHFLFNALNAVYFQIDKNNKDARNSLMQLSEILRYQLYDCNAERVPIDKEIIFLKNYIELQRLRLNTNYHVSVNIADSVKDLMIAPLLIMPLIENAFKYVSHHTDKENTVRLNLRFENGIFTCEVFNTTDPVHNQHAESGGIGLKNLYRRLDLLYPGMHEIGVEDKGQSFLVTLKLRVYEDQLHSSR